ncbi:hypothetical protein [Runella sp. SP2]|uniref:hypothetical protein n=1 Tax=Runella sp. SP2 TaxID=2268026 RepID=UPI000F08DB9E|nr:hypothetical protein [Runella sp. SP2]AYQ35309.1 hypothetical protein DTQ70_25485 [Runella sp. SP2]
MAEITFCGVCEGKVSYWNKNLNDGGGTLTYISVCYLFGGLSGYKNEIVGRDSKDYIMVQIPSHIIKEIVPTDKKIKFKKDTQTYEFFVSKITVTNAANFTIVIQKIIGGGLRIMNELETLNLNDGYLQRVFTLLKSGETINDTVSTPPCPPRPDGNI